MTERSEKITVRRPWLPWCLPVLMVATLVATTQVVGAVIVLGTMAYGGWKYLGELKNQKLSIEKEFDVRLKRIFSPASDGWRPERFSM